MAGQNICTRFCPEAKPTEICGALMASTRDAVVITDLAAHILAVNPAFCAITGYSEAEVLGKKPGILRSGRHDDSFYQAMWAGLLGNGRWQGELWNRRKDGEIYPELLTITVVRDEQGNPVHYLGVATDLTRTKQDEERLAHLLHYDSLTGLPSRILLEARLQHALERAEREDKPAAVLVIDLDRFKAINDSYGHASGDKLLVAVAERLRARLREGDTLSRLAGDQFVLVLERIREYPDAKLVAKNVQRIMEAPFSIPGHGKVHLRVSVGIAVFPQDGASAQVLLTGADSAVHQAKELGGGQICYYARELNARTRAALVMEETLRLALKREEFVLYYQPKVDLGTGHIAGAEALIRWQRPDTGLVLPVHFIEAAEKSGLIEEIGTWVIREACRQIRAWREAGLGEVRVAVNVSARQFRGADLEGVISEALAINEINPGCLMLELTESMLMEKPAEAVARMEALKKIGVRLSLDDFGTGYSSFAYLSRFPIDQIKIDRSFVSGITTDPGAATIATTIIAMAHKLMVKVVGEGVESEEQAGYLRQQGCDEMQGYLFSRPLPVEGFAGLLRQRRKMKLAQAAAPSRTLLIVDDEPHVLSAIKRVLADEGYEVLTAPGAREALELLARSPAQVVLSDQRMPGMDGIEFLGVVKELYPDSVRMLLTGYADMEMVIRSVNEGAIYKFFTKPWDEEELRTRIREAFYHHEMVKHRKMTPAG